MASGWPPETETRQRLPSVGFREEAKTISRLSAVQVMPSIGRASEVSCRAWPPEAGMTKGSCAAPVTSPLNAECQPPGFDACDGLDIEMLGMARGGLPGERDAIAVGRKRRVILGAFKRGHRHHIHIRGGMA